MCNTLWVRWTVIPQIAPQPWLACSGCGGPRAFQSSGKVRLNANGRKLDAWLVYKCLACDGTWNRPIFERHNVRDLAPSVLQALQSNDPDWIRAEAFNLEALRRKSQRIDEFAEVEVQKEILDEASGWTTLRIELQASFPVSLRLDRLLAMELGMSRSQLHALYDRGAVRTNPNNANILRRRMKSGTEVAIDLSREMDREARWKLAAVGEKH